jgi:DNA polymerase-3 subunit epsilon
MRLLALDFETSGLSLAEDRVIEVGMVIYDIELKQSVRHYGFLVKPDTDIDPKHWAEAEKIHGIAWDTVNQYGMPDPTALRQVLTYYDMADILLAHNGNVFDRPMLEAWATRYSIPLNKKLWIDTRTDLPRPLTGKLIYLAAEYGFVNPFPHRALCDAMTMLRILENFDIDAVIERAKIPNIMVQALVSYGDREKAKERGYQWMEWGGQKSRWLRQIKDHEVAREQAEAPFKIAVVGKP